MNCFKNRPRFPLKISLSPFVPFLLAPNDVSRIDFQTGEAILGRCGLAGIFFVGSSLSSS